MRLASLALAALLLCVGTAAAQQCTTGSCPARPVAQAPAAPVVFYSTAAPAAVFVAAAPYRPERVAAYRPFARRRVVVPAWAYFKDDGLTCSRCRR